MNSNTDYARNVQAVNNQLGNMPLPNQSASTTGSTTVVKDKKLKLPKLAVNVDPSFRRRFNIGKDVSLVVLVVKLLAAKAATVPIASIVLGIVSFQVFIPIGFALIVVGAVTGRIGLTEWGSAIAIGSSIAIWLL